LRPLSFMEDGSNLLPLAGINRIVKANLSENLQVAADSKTAINKAASTFIAYLAQCANEFCVEGGRSTISANDVEKALEKIEFGDFKTECLNALDAYKSELILQSWL